MIHTDPYGLRRVVSPAGVLPQAAERLDPTSPLTGTEIEIAVESINLDSASFRQISEQAEADPELMRSVVLGIVHNRGKMQNPVTGSGGMLIGTVTRQACGDDLVGKTVATLISLTSTPLQLDGALEAWDTKSEVIATHGRAIVFSAAALAQVPDDIDQSVALAVYDVCGAPALTSRILGKAMISGSARHLVVLGGGKSAVLASAAARQLGVHVTAVVPTQHEADALRAQSLFTTVLVGDAQNPVAVRDVLLRHGSLGDVTLVCVNAPGCEHAALLATRPGGAVIYFSMATQFSVVALGAEALVHDVDLIIGSGYVPGHAAMAIDLVRNDPALLTFFSTRDDHDQRTDES